MICKKVVIFASETSVVTATALKFEAKIEIETTTTNQI